jgi:hypothetical protein
VRPNPVFRGETGDGLVCPALRAACWAGRIVSTRVPGGSRGRMMCSGLRLPRRIPRRAGARGLARRWLCGGADCCNPSAGAKPGQDEVSWLAIAAAIPRWRATARPLVPMAGPGKSDCPNPGAVEWRGGGVLPGPAPAGGAGSGQGIAPSLGALAEARGKACAGPFAPVAGPGRLPPPPLRADGWPRWGAAPRPACAAVGPRKAGHRGGAAPPKDRAPRHGTLTCRLARRMVRSCPPSRPSPLA